MIELKRGRGRPEKIQPSVLSKLVDEYLEYCETNKVVPLLQEFALKANVSTDALREYAQKPKYSKALKRLEELSHLGWIRKAERENKPVFSIFMLKSRWNYVEATRLDVTSNGETVGVIQLPQR